MSRYKIRLEMAENFEFPEGDSCCGYEFQAPLTPEGVIDLVEWKQHPESFPVVRFWRDETARSGRLIYTANRSWHFHYSNIGESDDPTFQFDREKFKPGEFVSLRDHAGDMHIFHVVSVELMEDTPV